MIFYWVPLITGETKVVRLYILGHKMFHTFASYPTKMILINLRALIEPTEHIILDYSWSELQQTWFVAKRIVEGAFSPRSLYWKTTVLMRVLPGCYQGTREYQCSPALNCWRSPVSDQWWTGQGQGQVSRHSYCARLTRCLPKRSRGHSETTIKLILVWNWETIWNLQISNFISFSNNNNMRFRVNIFNKNVVVDILVIITTE